MVVLESQLNCIHRLLTLQLLYVDPKNSKCQQSMYTFMIVNVKVQSLLLLSSEMYESLCYHDTTDLDKQMFVVLIDKFLIELEDQSNYYKNQ